MANIKIENMVLITPKTALKYLEKNTRNRGFKKYKLEAFTEDMRHERWRYNGDSIRFLHNGELADGQHRLQACVNSGKPFHANIIYGLTDDDIMTIDTGTPRTNSDVLQLEYGLGNDEARHISTGSKMIIMHDLGFEQWPKPGGDSSKYTTAKQVVDWYKNNYESASESIEWINDNAPTRLRVLSGSQIFAIRILTSRVDPDISNSYLRKIITGFGIEEGSTEAHVRNYLLTSIQFNSKITSRKKLLTAAKGFRTVSSGRKISHANNIGFKDGHDTIPKFPGFGESKLLTTNKEPNA